MLHVTRCKSYTIFNLFIKKEEEKKQNWTRTFFYSDYLVLLYLVTTYRYVTISKFSFFFLLFLLLQHFLATIFHIVYIVVGVFNGRVPNEHMLAVS